MINIADKMNWEVELPAHTAAALIRRRDDTLAFTREFYEVRNASGEFILVAGVVLWSMLRPPELWCALSKSFTDNFRENLREVGDALRTPLARFPGLICEVKKTNRKELHFARHFGWREVEAKSLRPNPEQYIQFKVL